MKYIKIETVCSMWIGPKLLKSFFVPNVMGQILTLFGETISPQNVGHLGGEVFVYLFFIAFTVFAVPRLPDSGRVGGFPIF